MFCGKCGFKLVEGDSFCRNCGEPINVLRGTEERNEKHVQPDSTDHTTPVQEKAAATQSAATFRTAAGKRPGALKVFLVLFMITAVAAVGFYLYRAYFIPQPVAVVNKFANALNEKDINTLVTCVDPKVELAYKGMDSILSKFTYGIKFSDMANLFPALYQIMGAENNDQTDYKIVILKIISKNIKGSSATVSAEMEFQTTDSAGHVKTESGPGTFYLNRFNSGWRIVDLK